MHIAQAAVEASVRSTEQASARATRDANIAQELCRDVYAHVKALVGAAKTKRKQPKQLPAEQPATRPSFAAAWEIIVLVVKPDVSGKPEMASAPMMPQIAVSGIVRNSPPTSVQRFIPVRYTTTPALMNSNAL